MDHSKVEILALADWAEENDVMLDFIQPGKPTQNSYIERFNRTYRVELLDLYLISKAAIRLNEVLETDVIYHLFEFDQNPRRRFLRAVRLIRRTRRLEQKTAHQKFHLPKIA